MNRGTFAFVPPMPVAQGPEEEEKEMEEKKEVVAVAGPGCRRRERRHKERKHCERSMTWQKARCYLAKALCELIGTFFLGIFAVAAQDYAVTYGPAPLSLLGYGAAFAIVSFGLALSFDQFKAGHYNPALTLTAWFFDPCPTSTHSIISYLLMWLGQFLGFLLGALLANAYVGGAAPLGCTNIDGAVGGFLAWVMETLGLLFLCHIFVLAGLRRKGGPITAWALGTVWGILIVVFSGSTGGSFNLFRTLGVGIVEGCLAGDIGVYIGAFIAAPLLTLLLAGLIFVQSGSGPATRMVVVEECNMPEEHTKEN